MAGIGYGNEIMAQHILTTSSNMCFLFLFMSLFFSSRCMLELKFAISIAEQQVSPHRLPMQ